MKADAPPTFVRTFTCTGSLVALSIAAAGCTSSSPRGVPPNELFDHSTALSSAADVLPTMNSLRQATATANQCVILQGFWGPNDGGGGIFCYVDYGAGNA